MSLPIKVKIYEVGARDGLQNEPETVPTDVKVALINRLSETGLTQIESTAFVSPKWVPQMGDAGDVMAQITRKSGVSYPVLVPNERGLEAAIKVGVTDIAIFAAASESFSQKNINCSIEESFTRFKPIVKLAQTNNIKLRGYVSCVAGCPYEGAVDPVSVAEVAERLYSIGCSEISLGDTIGTGTPHKIRNMLDVVTKKVPVEKLALHCHDTYGQALVNYYAGLQAGIAVFDSSVAGLGGCPYAQGASGNVATEDVLYMFHGMGIETGVDLERIVETAWFISDRLGRAPVSHVSGAMGR